MRLQHPDLLEAAKKAARLLVPGATVGTLCLCRDTLDAAIAQAEEGNKSLTDAPMTRLEAAIFRIDNNLSALADDLARIQARLLQIEQLLRRIERALMERPEP
jgi:hypothetical protein